ncbi:hypothetical protein Bca52824_096768, partial [Brassica carinata]
HCCKSTVSGPLEDKNRVMATIKMENDVSVTLSLFDSQAVVLHKKLEDMHVDPKVIFATNINLKMIGGRLFLNATSEMHIYFDKETRNYDADHLKLSYKLVVWDIGLPSAAPLLRAYAKVENVTMAELNNFIITTSSQEIDFLCTGRVSCVDTDKGWCCVACLCAVESCIVPPLHSNVCGAVILMLDVHLFDGVMTKLHNHRASQAVQMLAEERVDPEDSKMPPFIADMDLPGQSHIV